MKTLFRIVAGLIILIVILLLLLLARSPIKPVAWTPAPNPGLTGLFAPNEDLSAASRLIAGVGANPEDVALGPDGFFYTGFEDGRIVRFSGDGSGSYNEVTNTGGRPLGMQFDAAGNLIVADAAKGLLAVTPAGVVTMLTDSVDGTRMRLVDDLDIAADGTVFFSDATQRFDLHDLFDDFLEASATGRLLSYSPQTGETKVRLENLFFANGVALGPGDQYVLVTATGTGRIHRLWLKGPQSGRSDLFFDGLPGNPDNLSFNGTDTFWVALPAVRQPASEALAAKPFIRKLLGAIPFESLLTGKPYGFIVGLGLDGTVKHNLQSPDGTVRMITSVNEFGGNLYLGSIDMDAVSVLPAPR